MSGNGFQFVLENSRNKNKTTEKISTELILKALSTSEAYYWSFEKKVDNLRLF
jgi:hypothetical protein